MLPMTMVPPETRFIVLGRWLSQDMLTTQTQAPDVDFYLKTDTGFCLNPSSGADVSISGASWQAHLIIVDEGSISDKRLRKTPDPTLTSGL